MSERGSPTLSQHDNGFWYIRDASGAIIEAYHTEFDATNAYERVLRCHEFKVRLESRGG